MPFFAISILAGLVAIPRDLYDAATIGRLLDSFEALLHDGDFELLEAHLRLSPGHLLLGERAGTATGERYVRLDGPGAPPHGFVGVLAGTAVESLEASVEDLKAPAST